MIFTKISRALIKSLNFRVMTNSDKMGFDGIQSPVPLIADCDAEGICIIIDGDRAELYAYDGCANFDLIDSVDSIRELPYKTEKQLMIEAEIQKMENAIAELKRQLA